MGLEPDLDQPAGSVRTGVLTSLRFHVALLGLILLALVPVIDNGYPALPDEGAYTAQADALANGSWVAPRPARELDRGGRYTALVGSTNRNGDMIPYARRPLYPLLLTPLWAVGGFGGAMLLSVAGTLGAALTSALISRMIDPRTTIWTLWLVGLGSPLLFDSFLVMGHAIAAGLAGLMTLATLHTTFDNQGGRIRLNGWSAAALLAASALTLVRTEGVIVVAALGLTLGISALRWRGRPLRVDWNRVLAAGSLIVVGLGTYVLNNSWARTITSGGGGDVTATDRSPDILWSAWTGLIRPWSIDERFASAALGILLITAVLAPLAMRFLAGSRLLGFALLGLGAAAATAHLFEPTIFVTGLLAAAPWIPIGLLSIRMRDVRNPPVGILLATAAVSTVMILATSYGEGGAAEWGGRFFHVLIPVIAPVAVTGLFRMCSPIPRPGAIWVAACILVATAAMSISAVTAIRTEHDTTGTIIRTARTEGSKRHLPVVVAETSTTGLPRLLWPLTLQGIKVLAAPDLRSLALFLRRLPAHQDCVLVLTNSPVYRVNTYLKATGTDNWKVLSATPSGSTAYGLVQICRR